MKISVSDEKCIGCGLCVNLCPALFKLENAYAVVCCEQCDDSYSEKLKEVRDCCLVDAIVFAE